MLKDVPILELTGAKHPLEGLIERSKWGAIRDATLFEEWIAERIQVIEEFDLSSASVEKLKSYHTEFGIQFLGASLTMSK